MCLAVTPHRPRCENECVRCPRQQARALPLDSLSVSEATTSLFKMLKLPGGSRGDRS